MTKNDDALCRVGDIAVALALLTRLPLPVEPDYARGAAAAWAYPLAGLVVATISGGAGVLTSLIGLPTPFSALIVLGFLIMLTGAMHEDGLADTADGLWGGWDREKRLDIMKDSHIGTYGVVAIFLGLAWRYAAILMLYDISPILGFGTVVAAALLSRAVMPVMMASLPHARDGGLSHRVGPAQRRTAALGLLVAAGLAFAVIGQAVVPALLAAAMGGLLVGLIARRKIGGQTGDILGASQQLAEIGVLTALLM